jgi:hypothetical protein
VAGSLPLLYDLMVPRHAVGLARPHMVRLQKVVLRALLVLPFVSIVAHLGTSHWVYKVEFYAADLAPLAIAIAIAAKRFRPATADPDAAGAQLVQLQAVLPAVAVLLSVGYPHALVVGVPGGEITPVKLAIEAAYLTYVYCFLFSHAAALVPAGLGMFALLIYGPSPATMRHAYAAAWERGSNTVESVGNAVIPETTAGWGVLSVIGSFVLLGIGAAVSLLKGPPEEESEPVPPAPGDAT